MVLKQECKYGNTNFMNLQGIELNCQMLPPNWDDILMNLYKATFLQYKKRDYVESYTFFVESFKIFLSKIFRPSEFNWTVPIAKVLCLYVRIFSIRSYDDRLKNKLELESDEENELSIAINILKTVNRYAVSQKRDDGDRNKKIVILHLSNQMFKIYFKLRNLNETKQMIKNVENILQHYDFNNFPMAEKVTWKYFHGIIAMFENQFELSEANLDFAFEHCPEDYKRNKKLILQKLICVKLILGKVPTKKLLLKYGLKVFIKLCDAYKKGDLKTFDQNINSNYEFFFKQGTYITMHKVRVLVFRNFFRKAITMIHDLKEKNKTRISLAILNKVLNKLGGLNQEIDETECILSSMIYQGYIKGYISHKNQMLVIANLENAFSKKVAKKKKVK